MSLQEPDSWRARASRSVVSHAAQNPSFVTQLKRVERDLDEAQHSMARHQYEAARARLAPHMAHLPEPLAGAVYFVMGQCAMHGAGHNWPALLHKARSAYQAVGDAVGLAHTRLVQGTGYFARGELSQAQTHLSAALRGFIDSRVAWGQAMTSSLRAQVCLSQHDLEGAIAAADQAVATWAYLNEASEEAMARQIRAQLVASAGRMQDAARDLLWAERLVGPDAAPDIRTQITLGRADSLLWMGYAHRAAAALSRVAKHAENHPDPCMRAHFHRVSGQALMVDAPVIAAQHLNIAVDVLHRLGQSYLLAHAQIYLTCCEHRLSLPTHARLQAIRALGIDRWPVLRDALQAVEPLLRAPPGRLTGPQPPRVFDPEAIADAPQPYAARPDAQAQGSVTSADLDTAPTPTGWTQWVGRVQQAWGNLTQRAVSGRVDVSSAPHVSERLTQEQTQPHAQTAPTSSAPRERRAASEAAPRQRRPQRNQAEVTQA